MVYCTQTHWLRHKKYSVCRAPRHACRGTPNMVYSTRHTGRETPNMVYSTQTCRLRHQTWCTAHRHTGRETPTMVYSTQTCRLRDTKHGVQHTGRETQTWCTAQTHRLRDTKHGVCHTSSHGPGLKADLGHQAKVAKNKKVIIWKEPK